MGFFLQMDFVCLVFVKAGENIGLENLETSQEGIFLHFDITGRQQKLKWIILLKLMNNADLVIVLNIVMSFEQCLEL